MIPSRENIVTPMLRNTIRLSLTLTTPLSQTRMTTMLAKLRDVYRCRLLCERATDAVVGRTDIPASLPVLPPDVPLDRLLLCG